MNGIVLKKMQARIGTFELKDIDLVVPKGTILGLLGRNGAGKTTLFHTLNGTYLKKAGVLEIDGLTYVENEQKIRESLSIVHDTYNVNPFVKGKRLLKYYKMMHPHFDELMFKNLCEEFKVSLNQKMGKLSLGMQKKLFMSLALSCHPKVLLLDEPFIGIDPIHKQIMLRHIQAYMEDEEHTIIFSSHQVDDLEKIADCIAIIDDGKIKVVEDKETLLDKYTYVKLDRSDPLRNKIIFPITTSFGIEGIIKVEDIKDKQNITIRPTLEQIFIHLSQAEVE